jgi:prepilin-type N-terminal cleavage/methylation domain-containing protein
VQKNSNKAFTLLEMIFVILISGILSIGTFKAFKALYIRSAKAKAVTDLSMQSQIVLDQISRLLYNRIPNSVIGYDGSDESSCTPIEEITSDDNSTVLEWLSLDDYQLISKKYSSFIDMNTSSHSKPDLNASGVHDLNITDRNLIFAGSFDGGSEDISTCEGAYGWHGKDSNLSYDFSLPENNKIKITDSVKIPDYIYEKYYLTDGAFAVARGEDIDKNAQCISDLNQTDNNNTLYLFYNYHPYEGETYCADKSGTKKGNVSILSYDVASFGAIYVNDIINLRIDMNKSINGTHSVHITKQKAVF